MAENTVVLNARMDPEVKEDFTALINKIMEENHLKKAGEAYAVLVETVKNQQNEVLPDFKEQINVIKANTNAILSSAVAMNDIFGAYKENRHQVEEKAQKELIDKINTLTLENKNLENQCSKYKDKIEELDKERSELQKELEIYRKQLSQQHKMDKMLKMMSNLIKDASGQETENDEKTIKPIPGQMNISDY